jgi:FADH2 O2-dependent halogenase
MDGYGDPDTPPYPMDDAAVHHVFDGGWMWVLRFNNGVTSAGVAVTDELAHEIGLADKPAAWERLLKRFPTFADQFAKAHMIRPLIQMPRLAYRATAAAGPGWVLLPSAAAFVDPLFSTGMPLTLLGIERLGRILEEGLRAGWGSAEVKARLKEYGELTLFEADWTAEFVAACYAAMPVFPCFTAFSMFYFAAASYSEMARRLERPGGARRFLAADHAGFAAGARSCGRALRAGDAVLDPRAFEETVAEQIEPLNIAGLCDSTKRNWYGIDLEDVVRGAGKLGLTSREVRRILPRAMRAPNSKSRVALS